MSLFREMSGAIFSDCRRYRYALWRIWEPSLPPCLFVMLNPSTADEAKNDPTIERCERRASAMGYGGLYVSNIFAFRSTDPAALYIEEDPVGPENDEYIMNGVREAALVICGWGGARCPARSRPRCAQFDPEGRWCAAHSGDQFRRDAKAPSVCSIFKTTRGMARMIPWRTYTEMFWGKSLSNAIWTVSMFSGLEWHLVAKRLFARIK